MFPKNKIEQLQLALKSLELYEGKIDGIIGPLTLGAIKKFEALALEKPTVSKPEPDEAAVTRIAVKETLDVEGADIEDALVFTLKNEGGYVDHPLDKGGPTNQGITIKTLSTYLGRKATKDDVKNLSYETIKLIYQKYYWDAMNLSQVIDQGIATAIFDMGVLCGTGTAARLCQEVLDLEQTKKMDDKTLAAINTTTDEEFIPKFAKRNIQRFEEIVQNHPSQQVFLRGWKNRADRLLSLINIDDVDFIAPEPVPGAPIGEGLYELADKAKVPRDDIKKMIDWLTQNRPNSNPRYWAVFKIKEHSKNKRMHIFDRVGQSVLSIHAVHGTGSDPDNDGLATKFSNTPNSHMSSLGLYRTLGTYIMARHGRALRLEGLESSNNKALMRGVVFHGVPYAGDDYVKQHGRCGRSFGCPAVEYSVVQDLIDKLKGGSLLLIS